MDTPNSDTFLNVQNKGNNMIKWLSTAITTPEADREIVAKNPLKPIGYNSAAKQCRVMKFHKDFTEQQIKETMLSDNFSLWAYTEGTSDD